MKKKGAGGNDIGQRPRIEAYRVTEQDGKTEKSARYRRPSARRRGGAEETNQAGSAKKGESRELERLGRRFSTKKRRIGKTQLRN